MKATYNITTDKLKAWFDERLPDHDYKAMRFAGFLFWHGSKCFVAKWSPRAEDLLLELGIESIEADDQPDNVEARVDRFAKYAKSAEQSAESSENYLNERANTERRRKNAINSIEKNLGVAEHWQQRIEGAIRHAQYKERADVIARRIRGLNTDSRRQMKYIKEAQSFLDLWNAPGLTLEQAKQIANHGSGGSMCFTKDKYPLSDYEGMQSIWGALDKGVITAEQARDLSVGKHERQIALSTRWGNHIARRMEYEKAACAAAGGAPEILEPVRKKAVQPKGPAKTRNGAVCEFLGAAGFRGGMRYSGPCDVWRLIVKVNRTSVEILQRQETTDGKITYYIRKEEAWGIGEVKTPAEVAAQFPEMLEDWKRVGEIKKRNAERAAQKAQVAAC